MAHRLGILDAIAGVGLTSGCAESRATWRAETELRPDASRDRLLDAEHRRRRLTIAKRCSVPNFDLIILRLWRRPPGGRGESFARDGQESEGVVTNFASRLHRRHQREAARMRKTGVRIPHDMATRSRSLAEMVENSPRTAGFMGQASGSRRHAVSGCDCETALIAALPSVEPRDWTWRPPHPGANPSLHNSAADETRGYRSSFSAGIQGHLMPRAVAL